MKKKFIEILGLLFGVSVIFTGCSADSSTAQIPSLTIAVESVKFVDDKGVEIVSADVEVNKQIQLYVSVKPSDATVKDVTWDSSDDSIATVSGSGLVTGVKDGQVTVTATAKSDTTKKAVIIITVTEPEIIDPVPPATTKFKVSFVDGTSELSSAEVEDGKTAVKPADPSKNCYEFENWYSDAALTTLFNFNNGISADTTVYAKFNPVVYTITYMLGETELTGLSPATYTVETSAALPELPPKEGCTADGWYEGTAKLEAITAGTSGNKILKAKYVLNRYTVTFDLNGGQGTVPAAITDDFGKKITLASLSSYTDASKTYTFVGWSETQDATSGDSADYYIPAKDVTLYAIWTDKSVWTVTFKVGTETFTAKQTIDGEKIGKPENPSKEYYEFENWYLDSALTALFNFDSAIEGSTTAYAKFVPASYSIRYMDGETELTELSPSSYTIESPALTLPEASKEGYAFDCWRIDGEKVVQIPSGSHGDIVLTASWIKTGPVVVLLPTPSQSAVSLPVTASADGSSVSFSTNAVGAVSWKLMKGLEPVPGYMGNTSTFTVDCSELSAGTYTVILTAGNDSNTAGFTIN